MKLSREKIQRMVQSQGSSQGSGGGSSDDYSGLLSNYVTIDFFNRIFAIHGLDEDDEEVVILPNSMDNTVESVEVLGGMWTEQYVSALGQNPDGGGGSVVLNACLSSINASALGAPTGVNTALIYNGNTWVYREMNDINMSAVWQALGASTSEQINTSHLTDVLVNYATASDVGTLQGYFTNGQANSALEADTLATARTIWGQSFDGSANITGNMTGVTNIDALLYFDTTNSRIGVIQQTPAYTLDVTGTMRMTGAATFSSTMTVTGLITANGGVTIPSSKTIKIGSAYLSYDSANNAIVVSANADGTGSANFYAIGGVSALGQGSGGSSGVDMATVWSALAASTNEQINASHLTTALNGYATQSWVTQQISSGTGAYLPLSGGTLSLDSISGFTINRTNASNSFVYFKGLVNSESDVLMGAIGFNQVNVPVLRIGSTNYTIWSEYNFTPSNYAASTTRNFKINGSNRTVYSSNTTDVDLDAVYLKLSGGTITGSLTISTDTIGGLTINRNASTGNAAIKYSNSSDGYLGTIGISGSRATVGNKVPYYSDGTNSYILLHAGNIANYNAGSATKLQTSRTIWGKSFDGTANVSGNMSNVGSVDASGNIISTISTGDGLRHSVTNSNGTISLYTSTNRGIYDHTSSVSAWLIATNGTNSWMSIGNVGIGTNSPSYKLHVNGTLGVSDATTITGLLTANGGVTVPSSKTIKIGSAYLSYDSTNNAIVVSANADGTGSANFYAIGGVSALGQGTGGSSGVDMATVWSALAASTNEQINASHLTTALNGYATQSWVTQQISSGTGAYLPLSGGTLSLDSISGFTINRTNASNSFVYFKGLVNSESDVLMGAIGFNQVNVPVLRIGSTNYTIWSEYNFTPSNYAASTTRNFKINGSNRTVYSSNTTDVDLDAVYLKLSGGTITGSLTISTDTIGGLTINRNASTGNAAIKYSNSSDGYLGTIGISGSRATVGNKVPYYSDGTNSYILLHAGNVSSYNAGSATKLQTSRTLWGQSFDGTANVSGNMTGVGSISASGDVASTTSTSNSIKHSVSNSNGTIELYASTNRGVYDRTASSWLIASNGTNSWMPLGNVGIGTTSPSYKLHVSGTLGVSGVATMSNGLKIGNIYIECDSSGSYSSSRTNEINNFTGSVHLQYNSSKNLSLCVGGGNVGIGTSSPSYKLHVSGDIYATGGVTCLSDARKKDVLCDLPIKVEDVANAPAIRFLWKDKRMAGYQAGTLAQYWQKVLPEVVTDKDDELSMQYGVAAMMSAIVTARKVVNHEQRIKQLEKENEYLKKRS